MVARSRWGSARRSRSAGRAGSAEQIGGQNDNRDELRVAQWLGRIAAVGAMTLLLRSAAAAVARPSHADPATQERSSSEEDKPSREFVGQKTPIQALTW